MKQIIFGLLVTLASVNISAQEYKNVMVVKDGANVKLDFLKIDEINNTYSYTLDNGQIVTGNLSEVSVYQKKGSYWLAGMLGGLGGGVLGSVVMHNGEGSWWYGAGPRILVGTLAGTAVGFLFPKYKEIEVNKNVSIRFNNGGLSINF
ncbi:hypothetical protein KRX57_01025 [Weeksellaceae bacterium TAE3-ERU29]|nr:hypothetical protein [Weeksellaceae bacterium TAE3-ERU29]